MLVRLSSSYDAHVVSFTVSKEEPNYKMKIDKVFLMIFLFWDFFHSFKKRIKHTVLNMFKENKKYINENFWWETTKTLDVSAHFSMKWYKKDNDEGKFLWNNFDFPHKHTHTKKIFTRLTHTHAIYLRLQNNVAIWKTTLRKISRKYDDFLSLQLEIWHGFRFQSIAILRMLKQCY